MPSSWIFSQMECVSPKSVKYLWPAQSWYIWRLGSNLTCPKYKIDYKLGTTQRQQNDYFENLYIPNHREARNIKFGQQVNLIQRVPLGTPPQEVATSLPYNHVTEELLLSHLGSKNSSLKEIHMTLLHLEVVTSLPLITRRLKSSSASCFKYFVIVKFSKFCRKDKCSRGSWAACRLLYLYMKQGN